MCSRGSFSCQNHISLPFYYVTGRLPIARRILVVQQRQLLILKLPPILLLYVFQPLYAIYNTAEVFAVI